MRTHSEHFSEEELSCRCCHQLVIDEDLLQLAETVRSIVKRPIIVNCAYRCPKHNKEVGGVENSYHTQGKAMDIRVSGMTPANLYNKIMTAYNNDQLPLLGGIGIYKTFVHVDTAKASDGHLRTWDER